MRRAVWRGASGIREWWEDGIGIASGSGCLRPSSLFLSLLISVVPVHLARYGREIGRVSLEQHNRVALVRPALVLCVSRDLAVLAYLTLPYITLLTFGISALSLFRYLHVTISQPLCS